jgi:sugar/nucleoside kinase (ribokinase family)
MFRQTSLDSVDYLFIGHLTIDLTPEGPRLGGSATYASLTAKALGLRVGIITSWGSELPLGSLVDIPIINLPADQSTTFENIATPEGRIQLVSHVAHSLDLNLIPDIWMNSPIVHLGPVAQEVEPTLVRHFSNSLIGVTPQGWLRVWDKGGQVVSTEWPEADFVLRQAGAAVISSEDIDEDEARIEELASSCRVLAVTEGAEGSRLFWNGDVRRFRSPEIKEVDATGAGDIFAAAFFYRLYTTRDPWESARFATHLSALSVSRTGLDGIPTQEEIKDCMAEVL